MNEPLIDPGSSTFVDLIQERAKLQPERACLTYLENGETESGHLDYAALDRSARAVAANLLTRCDVGDTALLVFPPGLDFVTAFIGSLYAGVIAIPVPPPKPNQTAERLEAIMDDAHVSTVLTTSRVQVGLEEKLEAYTRHHPLVYLRVDELDLNLSHQWIKPDLEPQTLAFLQYTSGTTNKPKGVMVNHRNLLSNSEYIKTAFELNEQSIAVSWLPNFHDMGLIDGILQPLYTGYHGYLMAPTSFLMQPIRWLRAITRYRATHCGGPNFGYDLCVKRTRAEQREGLDLSSWESAYNGAEPIHSETIDRFLETYAEYGFESHYMYPCYGLAEATLMVSGGPVAEDPVTLHIDPEQLESKHEVHPAGPDKRRSSVGSGRIWLDTEVAIVDEQSHERCAPHQIGEVWVSGPGIAVGYWQRPEATEETFNATIAGTGEGPFMRTGDLGFMQDGNLHITGRAKDIIIIKGRNYFPQDIERTVEKCHEALRQGCGAAFQIEFENEERLCIVHEIERSHMRQLEPQQVISSMRKSIAAEFGLTIHGISLLKTGSIPKTSSGKIQRTLCRTKYLTGNLISYDSVSKGALAL